MQVAKQADLIMLFYLMEEMFDFETIQKNYAYHEERTLHDSSLSMCIHALIAARVGKSDDAVMMYKKACGVDLDESLSNSNDGIHSASVGGIWLAFAMGFGGLRVSENELSLSPILPDSWEKYSFNVSYHNTTLKVNVDKNGAVIQRISGKEIELKLNNKIITV